MNPSRHSALGLFGAHQTLIILGCGAVAKASIPLLAKELGIRTQQMLIVSESLDGLDSLSDFKKTIHTRIDQNNYLRLLKPEMKPGDFVLNLAYDLCSLDLMRLCREQGCFYLDTCTEDWSAWTGESELSAEQRTLQYVRHEVLTGIPNRHQGPTAAMTHGINPGLISHFAKKALLDLAVTELGPEWAKAEQINWASLAQELDVRLIQISEYDSQQSGRGRTPRVFQNTWSPQGLIAEAGQPAEFGLGTHEDLSELECTHWDSADKPAAFFHLPGAYVMAKGWCPDVGPYHGFVITHAESISLCSALTVQDAQGRAVYRPTVYYCYRPTDATVASLHDLKGLEWDTTQMRYEVMNEEICQGFDQLGVLIGYGSGKAYWYGSTLDIEQARALVQGANATAVQVAAGVLGGVAWVLMNPDRGVVEPEDMDWDVVLNIAAPYLGSLKGVHTDWTPAQQRTPILAEDELHRDCWALQSALLNKRTAISPKNDAPEKRYLKRVQTKVA